VSPRESTAGNLPLAAAGWELIAPHERGMESNRRKELESQYEDVWREYGASLSRLAASYEFLPQAREDLLQEIRLAIWTALPRFRGESSMRTFIYRIAHNRALTHVWRRGAQPAPTSSLEEPADHRPTPESLAVRAADQVRLMQAIRNLPVPYRQVITMALDDLPPAEIAAVLGITDNNVGVRLNRARKMLREKLGGKP
jgi:RNA polymerase sigma factor (sigma-70 family)